jgi:hypothetical protein
LPAQVFDVLVKHDACKFSYKQPPAPHFSIAMMHSSCSNLPSLDEILDLALAVAGPATTAAAAASQPGNAAATAAADPSTTSGTSADWKQMPAVGSSSSSSSGRPAYQAVKFALPEEGDVSICELVPMRLMNMLTNK